MSNIVMLDLFENTGDGVWAVDPDERIIFWNASAERLLGFRAKDVVGKKCWRFLDGCDLEGQPVCCHQCQILARCLRGEQVSSFKLITSCHDGRAVIIDVSTLLIPQGSRAEQRDKDYLVHLFRLEGDAPVQKKALHVHLLGPTVVARPNGTLVHGSSWRRARVRALLAYFMLNKGLRIPRDTLIRDLWPNLPDRVAHHNLSTNVYYLRRSLEPNLSRGSKSRFIGYENGHYVFWDDAPHWIDIESFESELKNARREADQSRAVTLYCTALRYYRGDFQLDVKSEWLWHQSVRARLRTLYSTGLEELALLHEQLRQETEAIEVYSRLLTIRPWHEGACNRLMRLQLKRGEPEVAIYHYQNMAQSLRDEMNETPGEETQELFFLANRAI